jgi:hypothetical protein
MFLTGRSSVFIVSPVTLPSASASLGASNAFFFVFFAGSARIKSFPEVLLSSKIRRLLLPTHTGLMSLCHNLPDSACQDR